jgi:acetyltransferase-like isoleucine patch superfamily enzyme
LRHLKYQQTPVGRGTYGDVKIREHSGDGILKVGAFCSFGRDVDVFLGGNHRPDWVTTYPFANKWGCADLDGRVSSKGDVVIGNDVWVGTRAVIMSGVTIGDGVVVGAYSVVAKDLEPYGIYVGNSARLVRKRFDDATIKKLLEIKWWEWEDEKIREFLPLMLNTNIDAFIKAVSWVGGKL